MNSAGPPVNATPSNATHPPVVTPPAPPAPVNVTPPSTPPANTLSDQQVWNLITNDNAEKECLALAKQSTGMYSSIKTCVCDETLGQGVKTYICTVSTTQTPIPVSIICKLADRSCGWVSLAQNGKMTFEQITQSLGGQ